MPNFIQGLEALIRAHYDRDLAEKVIDYMEVDEGEEGQDTKKVHIIIPKETKGDSSEA